MAKYRIFKKGRSYVIKKRNFLGFWNYVKNEYVDLFSFSTEPEVKTFRTLDEAEQYIHYLSRESEKFVKEINIKK